MNQTREDVRTIAEPSTGPVMEPTTESVTEPVTGTFTGPIAGPATGTATGPAVEPTTEPVTGGGPGLWGRRVQNAPPFSTTALEEAREWTEDGVPVLRASVSLLVPEGKPWERIARFYRRQCRSFLLFCQGDLLPWARAEAGRAMERSVPVPCFRAELTCQETYRRGRLWSLYTRMWDNAAPGAASILRWGDTWDLSARRPVPAADFFPPRDRWKRRVLSGAEETFRQREERGVSRFHPGLRRALRRYWNPRHFYLTEQGIAFFWPMYALGPAAEGIPVYTLPYPEGDPPLAPRRAIQW